MMAWPLIIALLRGEAAPGARPGRLAWRSRSPCSSCTSPSSSGGRPAICARSTLRTTARASTSAGAVSSRCRRSTPRYPLPRLSPAPARRAPRRAHSLCSGDQHRHHLSASIASARPCAPPPPYAPMGPRARAHPRTLPHRPQQGETLSPRGSSRLARHFHYVPEVSRSLLDPPRPVLPRCCPGSTCSSSPSSSPTAPSAPTSAAPPSTAPIGTPTARRSRTRSSPASSEREPEHRAQTRRSAGRARWTTVPT